MLPRRAAAGLVEPAGGENQRDAAPSRHLQTVGPSRPVPLPDLVAHANDRNVHDAVEKPLADQLLHRPVTKPLGVKNDDFVPLLFEGVTYVGSAALGRAVLRHSDEALALPREKGR